MLSVSASLKVLFTLDDKVPHLNPIHVHSNRKITIKIMRKNLGGSRLRKDEIDKRKRV